MVPFRLSDFKSEDLTGPVHGPIPQVIWFGGIVSMVLFQFSIVLSKSLGLVG